MQYFDPNLPPPGPSDSFPRKRPRDTLGAEGEDCLPIAKKANRRHNEDSAASLLSHVQADHPQSSARNPESPPLHFHADMVDHRDINGCHSPETPHVNNGHSRLSFDQSSGMYPMYGGQDPVPHNGPHPFASEGLHSMPDLGSRVPHSPELPHGGGLHFGQPSVEGVPNGNMECCPEDQYKPELSADQNPHYYTINKVLYCAHWNRQNRFKHE